MASPVLQEITSKVSCHCGKVTAKVTTSSESVTAWDCNCSDCLMRGNVHFMVTKLENTTQNYNDETILYECGTKTAKHRFCKMCGILVWYTPRSNPDGFGVTLNCVVDWGGGKKPEIVIKQYDGVHWEESYQKSNIASETKNDE